MTDQRLVDELERALTDEVYDGGMGALSPEQLRDHVRGLAVTAAGVLGELLSTTRTVNVLREDWDRLKRLEAHTPTDDEREALAKAMCAIENRSKAATLEEVQAGIQRWTRHRYEADRLIEELAEYGFSLRRSEVPEPSAERPEIPGRIWLTHPDGTPKTNEEIRAEAAALNTGSEPQGEPSDAQVEAARQVLRDAWHWTPEVVRAALRAAWETR